MKKLNAASLLMIICAMVVIAFQVYWINSLYKNEKNTITKTTNALFKETVYEIQDKQTMNDTAFITKAINDLQRLKSIGYDVSKLANEVWHQFKLGLKVVDNKEEYEGKKVFEEIAQSLEKNTGQIKNKDSVTERYGLLPLDEIEGLYKNKLNDNENEIDLPFRVYIDSSKTPTEYIKSNFNYLYTDKVVVGQKKKVSYYAAIENLHSHIFFKILPQILISFFIVLFFIISIFFAYKTLNKQKQLVVAKNELISNITHEFKTPITTISVAIEAITKFGVIDDKELTKEYLQVSTDELNRLNLLVDKVLKLSLFESGKTELKAEKISLSEIVKDVLTNMKPQFDKHGAIIDVDVNEDGCIMADKSHIKSVVYNLIDNAIKYCNIQPAIVIVLKKADDMIELMVQDNGIGIAPQHQTKIFEKFYRVPQDNKHNAKGYGLGLSYISHIVKLHNGYINVSSALGKGSKFTVGFKQML